MTIIKIITNNYCVSETCLLFSLLLEILDHNYNELEVFDKIIVPVFLSAYKIAHTDNTLIRTWAHVHRDHKYLCGPGISTIKGANCSIYPVYIHGVILIFPAGSGRIVHRNLFSPSPLLSWVQFNF